MDTDVLIVGAGPTGLMLANQLIRRGIRTLIIDRHAGPSVETKAIGVQARTLEIYSHLGIVDRALELGKRGTGGNIWADGQRRARVGLSDAGDQVTPYPYLLVLGQDDNERLMGDHLRQLGSSVEWSTELVGLTQQPSSVTAVLKQPDGSQRNIVAAWVAGCDGARSVVRESNSITFAGAPYEHVFFVADTEMTGTMVPDEVNVYLFRDGFHLLFPMRGKDHWRIAGILPPALRNKPAATITPRILRRCLQFSSASSGKTRFPDKCGPENESRSPSLPLGKKCRLLESCWRLSRNRLWVEQQGKELSAHLFPARNCGNSSE